MYFVMRRLAVAVITLFLVSVLTFAAFNIIPGDPALLMLGMEATEEQLTAMRAELGLDRSFAEGYLTWLTSFFTGNLGYSTRFRGELIADLILDRLPVTFFLACLSLFFIIIISVPVSLFSSSEKYSLKSRLVNTFTAVSVSTPAFFLGVLFIWIFGIILRFFIPGSYISYQENFVEFLGYLIFPALTIAIPNAAIVIKFLRSSILQELKKSYVDTAYSKGASEKIVLYRHVFKNALIPAITLMGMIIGDIFSGSIIIEQVFTIPGVGRLLIASITSRDYPLIQTLVMYIALIVIIANTLVDIAIQMIDPRIRVR